MLLRQQLLETPLPMATASTRHCDLELCGSGQRNEDAQAFGSWIREMPATEHAFGRQHLASKRLLPREITTF